MKSLGTDFEMHAKWQGSIEEPAAKDFVARKVRTIKLNKVQGTSWNVIRCKQTLGKSSRNCHQTSNNQPWFTSLETPWGFLAQILLRWLSGGLCHARKCQFKDIMWEEKVWFTIAQRTFAWETFGERRNGERKPVLILVPGSHEHLALRKRIMCARNMGAHVRHGIWSKKGIKTGWEIGFPHSQERYKETSK